MHSSFVPNAFKRSKYANSHAPVPSKTIFIFLHFQRVLCKHRYVLINFVTAFSYATIPTFQTMV